VPAVRVLVVVAVLLAGLVSVPSAGPAGEQTRPAARHDGPVVVPDGVPAAAVGAIAQEVAVAERRVAAVWGPTPTPPETVVVVVPGPAALARATGRTDADVTGLVAVTTPGRVTVDLSAFDTLSAPGRVVLLAHELTHVATGSALPGNRVPLWLAEGFADEVGFTGSGIPARTAAAVLLDQVRRAGPPAGLPAAADFAPAAGPRRQAAAYAGAWLLTRLVAARAGAAALVAAYRDVASGVDVRTAFARRTGRALSSWVAAWRVELVRLAG